MKTLFGTQPPTKPELVTTLYLIGDDCSEKQAFYNHLEISQPDPGQ